MSIFSKIKELIEAKNVNADNVVINKRLTVGTTEYGEQTITIIDKTGKEKQITVLVGHKARR